jgi:uncharacterized cofD-like protein
MKTSLHNSTVLIGGGGGVYRVATILKRYISGLTTIQTMFDHGNHSGVLRDERGMLPPGDIRQAILALSHDDIQQELRVLLSHRFTALGSSIDGATIGNFMLTALSEHYSGDIVKAINALCRIFRVSGKVLPVSTDIADLCVRLSDGTVICGEGKIDTRSIKDNRSIQRAFLKPNAHIYVGARDAITSASRIVFCPGDLYTSIIPNALVKGFKGALNESRAKLIFIVNLMTKQSETRDFAVSDFARTLLKYIGRDRFDLIIVNTAPIRPDLLASYAKEKSYPVKLDNEARKYASKIVSGNYVLQGSVLRHSTAIVHPILEL